MGDWDNPPLFAVKKVAVVVLIIVVLVIVYSIYSQLQLYISYVCIYIYTHTLYICLYLGQYMVMVLSPVVVWGILAALAAAASQAFGSDKASGKGLRSGASCLEVLQKRSSAAAGGVPLFKAQRKQRNFDF